MAEEKKTYYLAKQDSNGRWRVVFKLLTNAQWISNKKYYKNLINQTKKTTQTIVNRKNAAIDAKKK